jgi:hypothetical protein
MTWEGPTRNISSSYWKSLVFETFVLMLAFYVGAAGAIYALLKAISTADDKTSQLMFAMLVIVILTLAIPSFAASINGLRLSLSEGWKLCYHYSCSFYKPLIAGCGLGVLANGVSIASSILALISILPQAGDRRETRPEFLVSAAAGIPAGILMIYTFAQGYGYSPALWFVGIFSIQASIAAFIVFFAKPKRFPSWATQESQGEDYSTLVVEDNEENQIDPILDDDFL